MVQVLLVVGFVGIVVVPDYLELMWLREHVADARKIGWSEFKGWDQGGDSEQMQKLRDDILFLDKLKASRMDQEKLIPVGVPGNDVVEGLGSEIKRRGLIVRGIDTMSIQAGGDLRWVPVGMKLEGGSRVLFDWLKMIEAHPRLMHVDYLKVGKHEAGGDGLLEIEIGLRLYFYPGKDEKGFEDEATG